MRQHKSCATWRHSVRGDVHRLNLDRGASGHEQRGVRYGVVLQADELAALSTCLVAPTSTSARAATFRPEIDVNGQQTRVLVEQTRAIDATRIGERVGHLTFNELRTVDAALRVVLSL